MRNHLGTVSASVSGAASRIVETDWTTGSLPAGWTSSYPSIGNVPTYSPSGTYAVDTTVTGGAYFQYNIVTGGYTSATLAIAYNVTNWTEADSALTIAGTPSSDVFLQFLPTAATADKFGYDLGVQFDEIPTGGATGVVVVAATMDSSGSWNLYRLITGSDTVQPISGSPTSSASVSFVSAYVSGYDFVNDVPGVSGDVRMANTYFNLDAALNQAAIEALATSWGWTP